jgi:hypothetical protein
LIIFLKLNYNKSTLDLYYKNQILISENFNLNKISNNLSISYNVPENLIEMRLNDNPAIQVGACFMDLFWSQKIEVMSHQNADIMLNLLIMNDKQIPLYTGNNGEYKTIIDKNVLLLNNWITTTRKPMATTKITTIQNTVSSSQNSFFNPWGILIIVGIGSILIIPSIVFILVFVYKRKKRINEQILSSNKNHSTFNSRNGLLFTNSNLSTSSASSIFSSNTSNERVNKLETPANQSNQSLLQTKKSLKKRNSEPFMNSNIVAHIGSVCTSDKSYCDCCNKTSTTKNNSERVKSTRNKSISSTNSSFILSANDDQILNTTTESLKTFGSNELNLLNGPSDTSTSSASNNNNILPNNLNEQFKQILNWTPSYDFFKDVLEDLSSLEPDENDDKNYYHETEQQQNIYYNNLKIIKSLNQAENSDYNHLYEKEICIQNNFIELPIDLNMLNHTLNSLSDNTQSFV